LFFNYPETLVRQHFKINISEFYSYYKSLAIEFSSVLIIYQQTLMAMQYDQILMTLCHFLQYEFDHVEQLKLLIKVRMQD